MSPTVLDVLSSQSPVPYMMAVYVTEVEKTDRSDERLPFHLMLIGGTVTDAEID